jgi:hypothetical protein
MMQNKKNKYTVVKLDRLMHDKLKILCIIRGENLQKLVNQAVSEFVERNESEIRNIGKEKNNSRNI